MFVVDLNDWHTEIWYCQDYVCVTGVAAEGDLEVSDALGHGFFGYPAQVVRAFRAAHLDDSGIVTDFRHKLPLSERVSENYPNIGKYTINWVSHATIF